MDSDNSEKYDSVWLILTSVYALYRIPIEEPFAFSAHLLGLWHGIISFYKHSLYGTRHLMPNSEERIARVEEANTRSVYLMQFAYIPLINIELYMGSVTEMQFLLLPEEEKTEDKRANIIKLWDLTYYGYLASLLYYSYSRESILGFLLIAAASITYYGPRHLIPEEETSELLGESAFALLSAFLFGN
ncbi:uncharacterized protein LOC119671000 isoform X1 [Teleopsis dalmanni]|uniref:uncharacterized protein LOC119671000 isoform X1 n=1 Tax=Teleopsis dalmanni TaxID=139649 RepID=UPI0018CD501E|nr:uncharacterized protein LOC119671000 isoform X1 [Teleopsis dalmanni]